VKGRIHVQLNFKEDHKLLSDNFAVCKSTLASLLKRLSLNPDIEKHQDGLMREQLYTLLILFLFLMTKM